MVHSTWHVFRFAVPFWYPNEAPRLFWSIVSLNMSNWREFSWSQANSVDINFRCKKVHQPRLRWLQLLQFMAKSVQSDPGCSNILACLAPAPLPQLFVLEVHLGFDPGAKAIQGRLGFFGAPIENQGALEMVSKGKQPWISSHQGVSGEPDTTFLIFACAP